MIEVGVLVLMVAFVVYIIITWVLVTALIALIK